MTMTLISKRIIQKALASLFLLAVALPNFALAQEALTLSISPSLFDISISPNQEWRSSLRVINVNDYDLTVYLDVVNFLPQGESGSGKFIPITNDAEAKGGSLAEWFIVSKEPIVVPREQSLEVPIAVRVPQDAAPGGHFAAILVGTKPPSREDGQARVQTSQMVTSLFFARVSGDIREFGLIREFTVTDNWLSSPEANFELRFENKGNVHLQPQGEIKITNMWGQERGIIPINQSTQFGNVLPESIRKFNFGWKGEWSISDIGQYTAEVTLAYGSEARQFASAKATFWVIPFKLLFGILLTLILIGTLVSWLIRLYVNHMLALAGIDINEYKAAAHGKVRKNMRANASVHRPMLDGYNDLVSRLSLSSGLPKKISTLLEFVISYKWFFMFVVLVLAIMAILVVYVLSANTERRAYEIEYVNPDANYTVSSEEIIYRQFKQEREIPVVEKDESLPKIAIINRSGVPGYGAEVRLQLEAKGYTVSSLDSDFTTKVERTVIVNPQNLEREALRLSAKLNNAPISPYEGEGAKDVITVYVGSDISALE